MSIQDINFSRQLWLRMDGEPNTVQNKIQISRFQFSSVMRCYKELRRRDCPKGHARSLAVGLAWAAGMEGILFQGCSMDEPIVFKPSQISAHTESFVKVVA